MQYRYANFIATRYLQLAGERNVIKVRNGFVGVHSKNLTQRSFRKFICLCSSLWSQAFSFSRLSGRAKFIAVLVGFIRTLKFVLLGCCSIKSVHFLVGRMSRTGCFLRPFFHALVITSRTSSRLRRWTVCKLCFCGFASQKVSTKPQLTNCPCTWRYARRKN